MTIRLGIDLGELEDEPDELYRAAQLAYIAAGGHAGDEHSIRRAIERCLAHGVQIGAHPSFDDRAGFGRVDDQQISAEALRATVFVQCARVSRIARALGCEATVLKLHGALYHRADRDERMALAALEGARDALGDTLTVVAWPDRGTARVARSMGFSVLREGFADRGVRRDGTLIPRSEPGALIHAPEQALARAKALAHDGSVDVLCVHGDNPSAVPIARAIRAWIDEGAR
jgi:UPF0271 protein